MKWFALQSAIKSRQSEALWVLWALEAEEEMRKVQAKCLSWLIKGRNKHIHCSWTPPTEEDYHFNISLMFCWKYACRLGSFCSHSRKISLIGWWDLIRGTLYPPCKSHILPPTYTLLFRLPFILVLVSNENRIIQTWWTSIFQVGRRDLKRDN